MIRRGPHPHPSGRPLRGRPVPIGQSIIRNPGIGPLVPRLRMGGLKDAIGFHRFAIEDSNDHKDPS